MFGFSTPPTRCGAGAVPNLPLPILIIPAFRPPSSLMLPSTIAEARTFRVFLINVVPPVEPRVNVVAFVARLTVLVWSPSKRLTTRVCV